MNPSLDELGERERRLGEVIVACLQAVEAGQPLDRHKLLADCPELAEDLAAFFEGQDRLEKLVAPLRSLSQQGPAGKVARAAVWQAEGLPRLTLGACKVTLKKKACWRD